MGKSCPKCHVGGYTQGVATDGRPEFKCSRCDYTWTAGKDGGSWLLRKVVANG